MINSHFYLPNKALLSDYYQFTMAQALFLQERASLPAVFHMFFRKEPFNGHYAVAAGVSDALDFVKNFAFDSDSLSFLSKLKSSSGELVFDNNFLKYLEKLKPKLDIFGFSDGDIIFAHEPMLRIEGPLALCMLLETPLLNIINFQTLIATKAMRMKQAAGSKKVIDFGLRRAQGFDGAISASKAAFIGGIDATSNVWAGKNMGLNLCGSQAHSFIMSFDNQEQAFSAFAQAFPNDAIFLCDTYDTHSGIKDAIKILKKYNNNNNLGIRLDSGDLLELSKQARALLDQAGLSHCSIIASNDLDEYAIERLVKAQAPIDIFGVGTRLISAHGDSALGGVYKLAALADQKGWRDAYKISDNPHKSSLPGRQALMRFSDKNYYIFDQIFDPQIGLSASACQEKYKYNYEEKLMTQALMHQGRVLAKPLMLSKVQAHARENIKKLRPELGELARSALGFRVIIDQKIQEKKAAYLGAYR